MSDRETECSVQLAAIPDTRMPLYPHPREASVSMQALWGLTDDSFRWARSLPPLSLGWGRVQQNRPALCSQTLFCERHLGTSRSIGWPLALGAWGDGGSGDGDTNEIPVVVVIVIY